MLKNWKKKLIAMLLIFTLTFSNFALVGKTYAASMLDGIFGIKQDDAGDTGSSNVEFDAYFKTSQDSKTSKTAKSDIKNPDLLVGVTVKVKNSGYLKDAKILFGNGKELNFVINNEVQVQTEKEVATGVEVNESEEIFGGEVTTSRALKDIQNNSMGSQVDELISSEQPANQSSINDVEIADEEITDRNSNIIDENSINNNVENRNSISNNSTNSNSVNSNSINNTVSNNTVNTVSNSIDNTVVDEELDDNIDDFIGESTTSEVIEETTENEKVEETEIKNIADDNDKVQSFESNQLNLVQLNADSEMNIEFPISYQYKKFVEEAMISKTNKIKFEGIYVNDDAEEKTVSKTVDLKLSWEDDREIKTSSEITKYIGFSQEGVNGIILQTSVNVDSITDDITLPIKDSKVEISVPEIDGVKPETVNVIAKSLKATTGKENDEVVFGEDNWEYDSEDNKITVNVSNKAEAMSTQNENDTLIDETAPIKDMYYSETGVDNYLITYTYKNVQIGEKQITTKVSATLNEFGETKLSSENESTVDLKDEVGSIVTYSNETTTSSVSKGYTYLNYNNEENKYEIEIDNKLIFNVSYKDIVEGLYYKDAGNKYVSKTGQILDQDDLYYKTLTISKENLVSMLGEEGIVNIYSGDQLVFTINKDTPANENGIIEVKFEDVVKNIQIETSKPINDGNLIFTTTRAYSSVSYEKEIYKDFEKLTINTVGRAKYIYLNDLVDIGNSSLDVELDDTVTKATLEVGQDSLSTLAMNNNVELKIELNNEDINSDIYGNSRFQIKLPKYVENIEVTDYNMVYGEGLELGKVQGFEQDGSAYIDIEVLGKQQQLSSGIVSHGTNIVLNANIKVDLFAPATQDNFELTYINEEATNYYGGEIAGYTFTPVYYSAPSGVVSVNSISGYGKDSSKTITSVNQGKVEDEIQVYSDKKVVKAELTIMNNEQNDISDIVILGRVPFEGVKDIVTGEDLGTNITTRMVSRVVPEDFNETEFKYYYSENGEATQDLNDSSNGWTDELDTLDNVKSFLIVPFDSEYKMEKASKLRFSYEYEIPENLEHNIEIYGTFATYYTNNTEIAEISDVSKADLVGLTTGEGPKFDIETTVNKEEMKEYEELEITTTVKNTGEIVAKDIVVTVPIPQYTKYLSNSFENEDVSFTFDESQNIAQFNLPSLEIDDTVEFKVTVELQDYYAQLQVTSNLEELNNVKMNVYSTITATDLDAILKTAEKTVNLKHAEMRVYIDNYYPEKILTKGDKVKLFVNVKNLSADDLKNSVATLNIPNGFEFESASVSDSSEETDKNIEYNEATRTLNCKIGDISGSITRNIELNLNVGDINEGVNKSTISMIANAKADGTDEYSSGNREFLVGRPELSITQKALTDNSYIKEGDIIKYQITVKNDGSVPAQDVNLIDDVPEGLVVKTVSYVSNGMPVKRNCTERENVLVSETILPQDELVVELEAVATSLNGAGERSITNSAKVSATNVDEIEANSITHIVESSDSVSSEIGEHSTGMASSSNKVSEFSKTYKITGTAWLDKNNDGMRGEDEELMKGVTATLVDSDKGAIKQTTMTNSKGEYTFTGVKNGNYIIVFDYDTVLYTVTVYQKENVAQNINSDVISTKIEQDGILRNGAVTRTVTVSDVSVSNIDIGLIEALKFDLSLDMGISKITTNTSKGTETKTYENSKLTKTEIGAKQVAGSEVYLEYTLTVKNEGEVPGFVKKIADYIPEGMEFNSGMNQEWYTGSDGILYTNQLSDIELQPGETKTLKLVLSKTMTDDNLGAISNTSEIVEDYNIYGVSDLDSTPNNKSQSEDDFARTDSYLSKNC